MKFFITFKYSLAPVEPLDKEAEISVRGYEAWLKNPRIKADYQFVGSRDSISIWEGDSLEQLHFDILSCPSHRMGEWVITPIMDNRDPGNWQQKIQGVDQMREHLGPVAADAFSKNLGPNPSITAIKVAAAMQ